MAIAYNPDTSGTHPTYHPVGPKPSETMAEAIRAFPTAVRVVDGQLIPIRDIEAAEAAEAAASAEITDKSSGEVTTSEVTAQQLAVEAAARLRTNEPFNIRDIPPPPYNGERIAARKNR